MGPHFRCAKRRCQARLEFSPGMILCLSKALRHSAFCQARTRVSRPSPEPNIHPCHSEVVAWKFFTCGRERFDDPNPIPSTNPVEYDRKMSEASKYVPAHTALSSQGPFHSLSLFSRFELSQGAHPSRSFIPILGRQWQLNLTHGPRLLSTSPVTPS